MIDDQCNANEVLNTGGLAIDIDRHNGRIIWLNGPPAQATAALEHHHIRGFLDFVKMTAPHRAEKDERSSQFGRIRVSTHARRKGYLIRSPESEPPVLIYNADVDEVVECLEKLIDHEDTVWVADRHSPQRAIAFRTWMRGRGWPWIVIIASVLLLATAKSWWEQSKTFAELISPNKLVFHQGGWLFNSEKHELHLHRGQWYLDNGQELMVPIEGPYNDNFSLRLEDHGRVYRINRTEMTRTELRVINGEWSQACDDGTWASIFNYPDDY